MRLHEPQNCVRTFCEQRLPTRQPHQTFANRDPRAVRCGRPVPNRVAGLRQQAPHTNMINRQGVACAPLGQATTVHGCRTPRSSHRRPDNPGTFRAPPSLNVGDHLLRHPEPGQRLCERHTPPDRWPAPPPSPSRSTGNDRRRRRHLRPAQHLCRMPSRAARISSSRQHGPNRVQPLLDHRQRNQRQSRPPESDDIAEHHRPTSRTRGKVSSTYRHTECQAPTGTGQLLLLPTNAECGCS